MKTFRKSNNPTFILVDVWAGDLHQSLVETGQFDDFEEAADFMRERVDAGMLCNVLHTDFKAPAEKVEEQKKALAGEYLAGGAGND